MNNQSSFPILRLALGLVLLFSLILTDITPTNASGVCYVKADASGQNDGSSWANAYTSLHSALGDSPCTEVWVATGTYTPTESTDRTISFVLKNGVSLYGGFAGTETQRSERDPNVNPTNLSGDIGILSFASDNSYHVVVGSGTDSTAVLDGFRIMFGFGESGAGMYNDSGSPSLANVYFMFNSVDRYGGGMYNVNGSSPSLTYVIFDSNSARTHGGGMYNLSGSNPVLLEVYFQHNFAGLDGAGMFNEASSPVLTNVYFYSNQASNFGWGGGMHNHGASNPNLTTVWFYDNSAAMGGGMFNSGNSSPTLTGVTFSENRSVANENSEGGKGGGMYNDRSSPSLVDVTFTDNLATFDGAGMYNDMSSPRLVNVGFSHNLVSQNEESGNGGGMYNHRSSNPNLENVTFTENYGFGGGGMYNSDSSSPTLHNVTFSLNWAEVGGAMRNAVNSSPTLVNVAFDQNQANFGAGMHNTYGSNPSLMNVTFNGGSGESGGGMLNWQSNPALVNVTFTNNSVSGGFGTGGAMINGGGSSPSLTNVTISGNYSYDEGGGGGIANYDNSNPIITNSIVYGNKEGDIVNFDSSNSSVSFSIVQGGYPGIGNLDADPLLVPLQDNGGFTQTMALGTGSPAIDSADDSLCPAMDQRGVPRPQGAGCDMGAYESEQFVPSGRLSARSHGKYDGWILESGENTGTGGNKNSLGTLLRLGDSPTNQQYRAILSFDTSGIPDNAVITSVVLRIKKQGGVGTDPFSTHGYLKVDVRQGNFSDNRALQLADFLTAASQREVTRFGKIPTDGWYSATLPEAAFGLINLGGETQFRLRFGRDDDNDLVADLVRFYSGNAEIRGYRPRLIIKYVVP